jgi:hypothetical protein
MTLFVVVLLDRMKKGPKTLLQHFFVVQETFFLQ